jgi:S-adenosylmethionine hydrolase
VPRGWLGATRAPHALFDAADLAQVIYVDHYGNAMTGLRAASVAPGARLRAGGRALARARTFGAARRGTAFWYENSLGLVEIAANQASAARKLGLRVGSAVVLHVR